MKKSILLSLLLCIFACPVILAQTINNNNVANPKIETFEEWHERLNKIELPRVLQKLKAFEESETRDNKQIENALLDLSKIYQDLGQPDSTAKTFQQLLNIQGIMYGNDAKELIPILSELASSYSMLNRTDDSILIYKRLIPLSEKHYGSDSIEIVKYLIGYAGKLNSKKNQSEIIEFEKRATAILTKHNSPLHFSSGLMTAIAKHREEPGYPTSAKNNNVQGLVKVKIIVNEKGDVVEASIVEGPEELRASAVEAAYKWRFQPYSLGGIPVKRQSILNFNFTLN